MASHMKERKKVQAISERVGEKMGMKEEEMRQTEEESESERQRERETCQVSSNEGEEVTHYEAWQLSAALLR